jgi:hypothetical protein
MLAFAGLCGSSGCLSSVEVLNILCYDTDKLFNHIPSEGVLFVMKSETFII